MCRIIFALICSCVFSGCAILSGSVDLVGQPAPSVRYYPLNGSAETTSALSGKVLVMAFWDASCRHCQAEMPKLNLLAESLKDNATVVFLALSVNEANEEHIVRQTVDELNLHALKQAFSGNGVSDEAFMQYHGWLVPYFVLIGKEGTVQWTGHSADGLREPLLATLNKSPIP